MVVSTYVHAGPTPSPLHAYYNIHPTHHLLPRRYKYLLRKKRKKQYDITFFSPRLDSVYIYRLDNVFFVFLYVVLHLGLFGAGTWFLLVGRGVFLEKEKLEG